jgi:cytochrome P450
MDPRNCAHLRQLASRAMSAESVEAQRPVAERVLSECFDAPGAEKRMDLVEDVFGPMTFAVAADLLGVPPRDEQAFRKAAGGFMGSVFELIGGVASNSDQAQSFQSFSEYILDLVRSKQAAPCNDLISALVQAKACGDNIVEADYVLFAAIFLFASQENIANFIGNAVLALILNPDGWEYLRDDQSTLDNAIEELMRFDSPVQFVSLKASEDLRVAGQLIKAGDPVLVSVGSANRDPARFTRPDDLDLARRPIPHLTFGAGHFYCIGATLARMEARLVLAEMARRFREIAITSTRLAWRSKPAVLRGLASLPVSLRCN